MEEATVSEHKNGKGYTLQISPDNYFAYVYIKDTPNDGVTKAELTYTAGGKTETLTDDVYPFEFIVKVDNPDVAFNYIIKAEGEEYGRGTLMTRALSEEKGIKEPLNKTNFAPVAVKGITDIDTNGQGLITAVGMPTNGENAHFFN